MLTKIRPQIRPQNLNNFFANILETLGNPWWARRDLNPRPIRYERISCPSRPQKSLIYCNAITPKRIGISHLYVPNTSPIFRLETR